MSAYYGRCVPFFYGEKAQHGRFEQEIKVEVMLRWEPVDQRVIGLNGSQCFHRMNFSGNFSLVAVLSLEQIL